MEKNQLICLTGKQEARQGVEQKRRSGSGWQWERQMQREDKRGNGNKAREGEKASFKDSGAAVSRAVRQQVNTHRSDFVDTLNLLLGVN